MPMSHNFEYVENADSKVKVDLSETRPLVCFFLFITGRILSVVDVLGMPAYFNNANY